MTCIKGWKTRQCGFTLIELLIAIGIVAIIGASVVTQISLLYSNSDSTSDTVTVQNQVENGAYWITVDARMAQQVFANDPSCPDTIITLSWVRWVDNQNIGYKVSYSINDRNELERQCRTVDYSDDSIELTSMVIARYIDMNATVCEYDSTSHLIIFDITASMNHYRTVSASSIVNVIPRVFS